jgi:aspartyl-tRNA(Asn)/glutamyl-tRNA(Gln) amidotransferase subunit B
MPDLRRQRFEDAYGLPAYDAEVLTARKDLANYYEDAVQAHANPKAISNWVMNDVLRLVQEQKLDEALVIHDWPVAPARLAAMIKLIDDGQISGKIAKTVFEEMVETGGAPEQIVEEKGLIQVSDEGAILAEIDRILTANVDKVAEYRAGKEKLLGFFVGQVMKATQGKANPKKVNELLKGRLSEEEAG